MTKNIFSDDVDAKLLDTDASRYDLAKLTAIYTNILKNKPELSSYHVPQLIKKALDDILSGAITPQEIIAAHQKHLTQNEDDTSQHPERQKENTNAEKSNKKTATNSKN